MKILIDPHTREMQILIVSLTFRHEITSLPQKLFTWTLQETNITMTLNVSEYEERSKN